MIGAEERRRLMSRFGGESTGPLGVVLKCAVGILMLVTIAAGSWMFLSAGGPAAGSEDHPAPQADAAIAESKRIFDERRRTFDAARHGGTSEASNATRTWFAVE